MSDVSKVEQIFLAAVAQPDPDQRAKYLDAECDGDEGLRGRVQALLAAHPHAQRFLEPLILESATVDKTSEYRELEGHKLGAVGTVIANRYSLVEVIGEGGMGTVWRAKQTEPVTRYVALKLIKPGMDSKQVLARFEAERQALAMMDHPNIARILDGGIHDNRPFFVMELVKGTPITEFCDARKLTPQQRLELFLPVCQAIQHAHQKGIIHRDIKPSNVLIALYDDQPVPKVIDFGVAKATGGALTQHTIDTGFGGVVGTPQYMSPEQATFNNLDIDTRSDVYSLGTLLYELLAGSPPFAQPELEKRGLLEILRVVREEEPPRPSLKLSTAEARASISANRSSEPLQLSTMMKGEIDWIVMKALEKDRTRRYDTATALAKDVQRYLTGDAVEACPPTLGYRMRKAYRRNRTAVRVTGAFMMLMLTSVVVSSLLAVKANREATRAREAELEAVVQAEVAKTSATIAGEQTRRAEMAVVNYRMDLDLASMDHWTDDPRTRPLKLVNIRQYLSELAMANDGDLRDSDFATYMADRRDLATLITIAVGQTRVSLLPPLQHDGTNYFVDTDERMSTAGPIESNQFDLRDGRMVLIRDKFGVLRLVDALAVQSSVTLRQQDEQVMQFGFSPDGRTIYTQDQDCIVRFWNQDCTFRAKTSLRPDRFVCPPESGKWDSNYLFREGNGLIVGNRSAVISSEQIKCQIKGDWEYIQSGPRGPDELYDTATGQLKARLDRPSYGLNHFNFSPDGRLLTAVEDSLLADGRLLNSLEVVKVLDVLEIEPYLDNLKSQVVVFDAENGKVLRRIPNNHSAEVSKNGTWLLTRESRPSGHDKVHKWHLWDTSTWAEVPLPFLDSGIYCSRFHFVTDDLIVRLDVDGSSYFEAIHRIGGQTLRINEGIPDEDFPTVTSGGELLRFGETRLIDLRTLTRLRPPVGLRFHPRLSEAVGGRFLKIDKGVVDTRTDKMFIDWGGSFTGFSPGDVIPGAEIAQRIGSNIRLLPKANRLDIPQELLQLWAQVAVCGELGPNGEFVEWKEETWEQKRQELAAAKPPYEDFPFPGYVATDKLHWLRAKYGAEWDDVKKLPLIDELLRRSEESGDKNEAVRWRTERAKYAKEAATPEQQSTSP